MDGEKGEMRKKRKERDEINDDKSSKRSSGIEQIFNKSSSLEEGNMTDHAETGTSRPSTLKHDNQGVGKDMQDIVKELPTYAQAYLENNPQTTLKEIEKAIAFKKNKDQGTFPESDSFCLVIDHLQMSSKDEDDMPENVTEKHLEDHFKGTYDEEDIRHAVKVFRKRHGFIPCAALFDQEYWRLKGIVYLEKQNSNLSEENKDLTRENEDLTRENEDLKHENTSLKNKLGEVDSQLLCKICFDKMVAVAFLPCGHLAACTQCDTTLKKAYSACPVCRGDVKGRAKIFI